MLLCAEGINADYVRQVINLTQTTSASYLLMVSLDIARRNLALNGREMYRKAVQYVDYAREEINRIGGYYVYGDEPVSYTHLDVYKRQLIDMAAFGDFLAEFILPFYRSKILDSNGNMFRIAADCIYQCSCNFVCCLFFLFVCSAFQHFDRNMWHFCSSLYFSGKPPCNIPIIAYIFLDCKL